MGSFTFKEFLMKRHFRFLSIILVGLLGILISGCNQGMDTLVDTVVDLPPPNDIQEPSSPPVEPTPDPSYTFHGFLDHQETIHALAFSPDGQTLASLGEDNLKVWDIPTEQLKSTTPIGDESLWILGVSDGGETVAVGKRADGMIQVSALPEKDVLYDLSHGHTAAVRALVYSSDGLTLATASSDKTVRVWDPLTTTHKYTLDHEKAVWAVAFSPDAQTLATGGSFEGIHLWDATAGESKGPPLIASTSQVESVAFGPDGQTLFVATGRSDGKAIHVWDLRTNQLTETLMAEGYTVRKLAVRPDGQLVAGGAHAPDGLRVLLWKR